MDLSNYTSDRASIPANIVIKHPVTGADTEIVFQVIGLDSQVAQNCIDAQQVKRFVENTSANGDYTPPKFDPVKSREQLIELLSVCTVGWSGAKWKGEDFPFSTENAVKLYTAAPFIRDQISKATGSRQLFFADSDVSS
jgi:hypothetical protein